MSYIFGGNTGLTYDQIQRRRQLAQAMMASGMRANPQNAMQGLNAAAQSIVGAIMTKRLGKQDQANRDAYTKRFQEAFGGGSAPSSYTVPVSSAPAVQAQAIHDSTDPSAIAGDTMAALGVNAAGQPTTKSPYADAIAGVESAGSGDYSAMGPVTRSGDRAYGRYQVMGSNVGPWTEKWYGKALSPQEFLANQAAQDAVFNGQFGSYVKQTGNPQDAASMWFTGRPMAQAGNASDGYTTAPEYVSRFNANLGATPDASGGAHPQQYAANVDIAQLAALASSPYATPEQKAMISSLMQQQMHANDPYRQAQIAHLRADTARLSSPLANMPNAFKSLDMQARAAGLVPGTQEYQSFMRNGGGDPANFRSLDMQAKAAGLTAGTPEYERFMATHGAFQKAQAQAAGKVQGEAQGRAASLASKMDGLNQVVSQLKSLSDQATYTMAGQAVNWASKELGLGATKGAVARSKYEAMVNNQILPLLRDTFGAQFTEREGASLRATLGDPNKTPAEKQAVLEAFIAQKKRDLEALRKQAGGNQEPPPSGGENSTSGGVKWRVVQ